MSRSWWKLGALAISLALLQAGTARAQYGYGYGWGGYGGGGQTPQGDMARGMGVLAAGAGEYNQRTAAAIAVNAQTAAQWNEYVFQSQMAANRRYQQRMAQKRYGDERARDKVADRLRNDPEPRDVYSGDALNVAYDEINDPRVYTKALKAAGTKIGGEAIRDIPFQYAAAAISTSVHQIMTKGSAPASLKTPAFEAERAQILALAESIHKKTDVGENPDPADIDKALKIVEGAEAKVEKTYKANSRERNESMKYLKALHGLLRMMETPAINLLLAGAEKRPDATVGQLMMFMQAYNLRFGPATSPRQKQVYDQLYPILVTLRSEVAPALAAATSAAPTPPPTTGGEHEAPGQVFSGISTEYLQKKPVPPPPPEPRR